MTRTRTAVLMTAAVSALGLMLASGGAMAQATGSNDTQAKARQIVVEAKADEAKAEEAKAPAAKAKAEKKPEVAKAEEAPAKDAAAALTDEQKSEVAKAIEESNAKAEEPGVKVVEEPAPVVKKVEKKKVTSKVVIVEQNGVFLKVRKYSNGKHKVLGYAHGYGYEEPSYDYGYSHNYSGSYGHSGGYNSYGYGGY